MSERYHICPLGDPHCPYFIYEDGYDCDWDCGLEDAPDSCDAFYGYDEEGKVNENE